MKCFQLYPLLNFHFEASSPLKTATGLPNLNIDAVSIWLEWNWGGPWWFKLFCQFSSWHPFSITKPLLSLPSVFISICLLPLPISINTPFLLFLLLYVSNSFLLLSLILKKIWLALNLDLSLINCDVTSILCGACWNTKRVYLCSCLY